MVTRSRRKQPVKSRQQVDLNRYNSDPQSYNDGSKGFHLPTDFPAYAKVFRLLQNVGKSNGGRTDIQGLAGWTLELNCFTFKAKLFVKVDRIRGKLTVFLDDGSGAKPQKIASIDKRRR